MLTLYYAIGIIVLILVCFAFKSGWCLCGDEDDENNEEPCPKYEPELPRGLYWRH
tara:strand:- start:135 stop:299 length:165 start_codon:yes stop_codon:yes gene_type:complete